MFFLNKAIELDSNYLDSYLLRGDIYLYQGDYDRAMEDYNKILEIDNKNIYAYIVVGYIMKLAL